MWPQDLVEELHLRQAEMYAGGSLSGVTELLADDIVWHVPGSSPIAGDHRRHDGVIKYFETRRRLASNTMKLEPAEMLTDDDCVVQRVDGTAVIDEEPVAWKTVGIYRVKDGQIAEVWLVPLDLEQFNRIWKAAAES
jgi:ketosteroid isomerase-like protein